MSWEGVVFMDDVPPWPAFLLIWRFLLSVARVLTLRGGCRPRVLSFGAGAGVAILTSRTAAGVTLKILGKWRRLWYFAGQDGG